MTSSIFEHYAIIDEIERNTFEINLNAIEKKTGKYAEIDILNPNKIVQQDYSIKEYIYRFNNDCTKYIKFNHPAILKLKTFSSYKRKYSIFKRTTRIDEMFNNYQIL